MANTSQDIETFTKSLAGLQFNSLDNSSHAALYKQKQTKSSLDERRAQFLEDQKRKRFDYMNLVRDLTETDWYVGPESMEYQSYPQRPRQYFRKDQLMLSEWMTEVPIDFEEEWLCVPCPMGKRCLVVASRGKTSSWTKAAFHMSTFNSCFPGGNIQHTRDSTILDCLYNKTMNTYYILDLMSWRGQPLYDSETEFRFYWLHTKLQECPEIQRISKMNTSHFVPLTSHPCSRESIYAALDKPTFNVAIDGVLFYHRRAHYTLGSTPLVGWLKPFMLPEIIDVDIPQRARSTRPPNYVDYKTYIDKFNEKYKRAPGGMFKKSKPLQGNKGRGPIIQEPYVPRDIRMREQTKAAKKESSDEEGRTECSDESMEATVDTSADNIEDVNVEEVGKVEGEDRLDSGEPQVESGKSKGGGEVASEVKSGGGDVVSDEVS